MLQRKMKSNHLLGKYVCLHRTIAIWLMFVGLYEIIKPESKSCLPIPQFSGSLCRSFGTILYPALSF